MGFERLLCALGWHDDRHPCTRNDRTYVVCRVCDRESAGVRLRDKPQYVLRDEIARRRTARRRRVVLAVLMLMVAVMASLFGWRGATVEEVLRSMPGHQVTR